MVFVSLRKDRCRMKKIILISFRLLALLLISSPVVAQPGDTLRHWGFGASLSPGQLIVMDGYQRKFQKNTSTTAFSLELDYTPQPADGDPFAHDYNYPTFGFGIRLNRNNVTMHRKPDPAWGMIEETDYDSRLGNILTAYTTFTRPLLAWPRKASPAERRFEIDYMLGTGFSYAKHKYSQADNIDNELIGSRVLIYFTAATHATWHPAPSLALFGGIEFYHHSNGALNRPNKGANFWGPVVGARLFPGQKASAGDIRNQQSAAASCQQKAEKPLAMSRSERLGPFVSLSLGIGGKTLLEDWQLTQFNTPPSSPRYRTSHFRFYTAYSLHADLMHRYARRWASGIGIDAFYGTYAHRVREIEENNLLGNARGLNVGPWSLGLALKHHAYYGNLSLRMSLGYYLLRHMGSHAKTIEKPYYESIGLHYSFPKLGGMSIGASVNAHLTKADLTEIVLSYPFRLGPHNN